MEFHQYFLCKSRYCRLLSPCAAPAHCAKHFIFKVSKVNHLINTPIPLMSLFSLCGVPVVLKCLVQMTESISYALRADPAAAAACWCFTHCKSSYREWRCSSHPGGFCEIVPLQPAVGFKLFFPAAVHLPRVLQRVQDHVKYSQVEQHASACVFQTTSSVVTDNCSLATKSVSGIGNPPGWYLALKS